MADSAFAALCPNHVLLAVVHLLGEFFGGKGMGAIMLEELQAFIITPYYVKTLLFESDSLPRSQEDKESLYIIIIYHILNIMIYTDIS